ncbi:MAG: hydantoinase/oxoprolinase family protein [Inquilinaceae bacterium]
MSAKGPGGARTMIGVDVGGTFTDVFFYDEAAGRCDVAKVPSTRGNQSIGFLDGIRAKVDDLGQVATVVHGTTVGTNALLERKGARSGIITTAGFRDVLEMRRRDRPQTWGLWGTFEPVIPRDLRLEVAERTLADGTVRTPVDPAEVAAAARTLLDRGAESVSVVFINAYANPANETTALEAVKACWPNPYVNASSRILPEIREFERASTTSLNAYLQPVVASYLQRLEDGLAQGGFGGEILIVQSNGGVMSVETARGLPIRTALSGPAAGVIAGAHIATTAGFPNVITCDMGGTSFDVSLVAEGQSVLSPQTAIDFGMVVRSPMIEITTIGAGGGSIAWVDRGGLLQIGPESAGSDPGPACYGLGNDRPTVTDANVVLGRINADRPIGGKLDRLDVAAAERAIAAHVGEPLGLMTVDAAEAIIRVANSRMAGAIRLVSVERGHDPKKFVAMPFGGGGALHAGALIREVGLSRALVPPYPGVTSALGCVIADMRHDFVHTLNGLVASLDEPAIEAEMARTAESGRALLKRADVPFERIDTVFEFDMSYVGQTHTVAVPFAAHDDRAVGFTAARLAAAFETAYRAAYGTLLDGIGVRVLNLRTSVIGRRPKFALELLAPKATGDGNSARTGARRVYADGAWHDAAVYARLDLAVGSRIEGPALLEQPDTTIFVDPDMRATIDRLGNLLIERKG